jgi:pimeloyl-ACP methyl ester carboxylesterase
VSIDTSVIWRDTPNLQVEAAGVTFAYRRLGANSGIPLVMLNHWGANLDNFDPRIVDELAQGRTIYALNYRGVGGSGGKAPTTMKEMAADMIAVIKALGLSTIDLLGFSLGGFVAQDILRQAPDLVRKVILSGTGPAGGAGIRRVGPVSWPLIAKAVLTRRDPKFYLFFTASETSRLAANAFLNRLKERVSDRDKSITSSTFLRQLRAIQHWGLQPPQDLGAVAIPALVVNGDQDIMVPSQNTIDMAHRLPNADLVLYPDAGHGGIFQFHDRFVSKVRDFLDA